MHPHTAMFDDKPKVALEYRQNLCPIHKAYTRPRLQMIVGCDNDSMPHIACKVPQDSVRYAPGHFTVRTLDGTIIYARNELTDRVLYDPKAELPKDVVDELAIMLTLEKDPTDRVLGLNPSSM